MSQNLFAYTEPHNDYPAFISINKDDDGKHRISVRSAGNGGRDVGNIVVTPEILEHLAVDVLDGINGGPKQYPACKGADCGATDGKSHSVACQYEYALSRLGLTDTPQMRVLFWDFNNALQWDEKSDQYIVPEYNPEP